MQDIGAGQGVVPQKFIARIYANVPGINYINILAYPTTDAAEHPDYYEQKVVEINARQRAVTDETRIEVVIDG